MVEGGERSWWFGANQSAPEITEQVVKPFAGDDPILMTGPRVLLTDFTRLVYGGDYHPFSYQLTGSCVHSGYWNAHAVLAAIECTVGVEPEVFSFPFLFHIYAASRFLAFGKDTRGEGSSGDAMALAGKKFGKAQADLPAVAALIPRASVVGPCIFYDQQTELEWSRWGRAPQALRDLSAPHQTEYEVVSTLDQAETAIRQLKPMTWAGNWGGPDTMRYRGSGANRVLWGDHTSRWEHQQACLGVWYHPEFGRIWLILNNWYYKRDGLLVPMHGEPGTDEPRGSYWIDDKSFQSQLSYKWGEVRALKSFKGFDSGKLNHLRV